MSHLSLQDGSSPQPVSTLDQLAPGSSAVITKILNTNRQVFSRLLSFGIVTGTCVKVIAAAPFGDPIKIAARGCSFSLRLSEASNIEVALTTE